MSSMSMEQQFGASEWWTLASGGSFGDATVAPTVGTLKRPIELCSHDDEELSSSVTSSPLKKRKTGLGKITQSNSTQSLLRAAKQKIAPRKIRPLPNRRLFYNAAKPVTSCSDSAGPWQTRPSGKDHGFSDSATSDTTGRCFDAAVAIAKIRSRRTNIDTAGLRQISRSGKDRGPSESATSDAIGRYFDAAVANAKKYYPRPSIEPEYAEFRPASEFVIHEDPAKEELGTSLGCSANPSDIVDDDDLSVASAYQDKENVAPFDDVPMMNKTTTARKPLGELDIAEFYPAVEYDSSDDEFVIHQDFRKEELVTPLGCSVNLSDIVDDDDLSEATTDHEENVAPSDEVPMTPTNKTTTTRKPLGDLDIVKFYPAAEWDSSDEEL
ncbi:hypothetical protein MMC07_006370 [Pseudocyphellaria aurata]|nr:hypothetical protein [Pseudocyphellaria aurata]